MRRPRLPTTGQPVSLSAPGRVRELYRLRADALLADQPDSSITLSQSRFQVQISKPTPGCRAMLLRLAGQWTDDGEVGRLIAAAEGESAIMKGQSLLCRLVTQSWLRRRLQVGDRPLLDIIPLAVGAGMLPPPITCAPLTDYRLSRFITVSADVDQGLTARTPLATVAVAFADSQLAGVLVRAAGAGCTDSSLAQLAGLDQQTAATVLNELLTARVLVSSAEYEAETSEPPVAVWAADELSLHDRARTGRHALPIGGTYRFRGQFPAEALRRAVPARTVSAGASGHDLRVPDLDQISRAEPSLTEVITRRRSVRRHDDAHPITIGQLGEFLYRVQHTTQVRELSDGQEVGARPYPDVGQLCTHDIYPLISRCTGIDEGLYWYDSIAHRLIRLSALHPAAHRMLAHAQAAAIMPTPPQVLLVISARVQRILWKYEGMGYSLALKNAGVLTGLMYMVATAMELAPCALGSGDSASFALLSGLDPLVEPSIADFALGSSAGAS